MMNPDYYTSTFISTSPRWWTLQRDDVVYTFSETSGNSSFTAGKIRIESSSGEVEIFEKQNARTFWNSLITSGYTFKGHGRQAPAKKNNWYKTYEDIHENDLMEMRINPKDFYKSNYALEA